MRILRLRARDFMPYADLDLDLTGAGVWAVVGDNGAGKSTLLDLIRWSLTGTGRYGARATDKYVRDGAPSCLAEVTFETPVGRRVTVIRERERSARGDSSLTLMVDGVDRSTKAAIRATQAEIDDLVGMDPEALMAGPLQEQERSGTFAGAGPARRKDILANLLGLDEWQRWHDRAKELAATATGEARAAEAEVARAEAALAEYAGRDLSAETDAAMAALDAAESEKSAAAAAVEALNARVATSRKAAANAQAMADAVVAARGRKLRAEEGLRLAERTLAEPVPEVGPQPSSEVLAAARAAVDAQADLWRRATVAQERARTLAAEAVSLGQAAEKAKTVPCGAVGEYAACRFLTDIPAADVIAARRADAVTAVRESKGLGSPDAIAEAGKALRVQVRALEDDLAAWQTRASAAAAVMERRSAAEGTLEVLRESVGLATREVEGLAGLAAEAESAAADLAAAQAELAGSTRRLTDAVTARDRASQALVAVRVDVQSAQAAQAAIEPARARAKAAQSQADLLGVLVKAFHRDGVPTMLLELSVPLIEHRANEVLARMPGGLRVALPLERGRGGVDELNVIVTRHDRERDYEGLSVGQRFRVDLALRLGLTAALGGSGFSTLWIDEGFAGQTKQAIPDMVEALLSLADEVPLIVVVSHVDEVTERVPARITVTMDDDGVSTAVAEGA